jgi:hypothetical protein
LGAQSHRALGFFTDWTRNVTFVDGVFPYLVGG